MDVRCSRGGVGACSLTASAAHGGMRVAHAACSPCAHPAARPHALCMHAARGAPLRQAGRPLPPLPLRRARGLQPGRSVVVCIAPFDQAWGPNIDAESLAPELFGASLFPYLAFLFFITKSGKFPKLTEFGFYFLLAFVFATIPAGIYAKTAYGTSLANVDWLHGTAESLLTITNLMVVLGLRKGIREAAAAKQAAAKEEDKEASVPKP